MIINIKTSTEYNAVIERNILNSTGKYVSEIIKPCRALIVTDDIVAPLYLNIVSSSLSGSGFLCESFIITHGEASKNLENVGQILEYLAEKRFSRTDIIIALGGGVVGDLSGFCAAIYLRGIRFAGIPTTLLAAVDSSVGGKTAVNLRAGKNLAGAFHQPSIVVCDICTFDTLDDDVFADGIAEAVKYGIICDRDLFDMFNYTREELNILEIVEKCVSIKSGIVSHDIFDNGERKLLNLGHTVAHAIEKLSGYAVTHGHAVASGMVYIANVSEAMGIAKFGLANKIAHTLALYGLDTTQTYSAHELLKIMTLDKKVDENNITLVMPRDIGDTVLHTISLSELEKYIMAGELHGGYSGH